MVAALAALGAIPVALQPPQIREAALTGQIDGAVMAWDVVAYTQTAELLPFHTDTKLYVSPLYFGMNRARYDTLPANVRDAVDAASGEALVSKFPGGGGTRGNDPGGTWPIPQARPSRICHRANWTDGAMQRRRRSQRTWTHWRKTVWTALTPCTGRHKPKWMKSFLVLFFKKRAAS